MNAPAYYLFEDEYQVLISQYKKLEQSLQQEYARKGEAAGQTGNSRHDNFDYEDAERTIRILTPRVAQLQGIIKGTSVVLAEAIAQSTGTVVMGSKVQYML
jgi:hypothetical protein